MEGSLHLPSSTLRLRCGLSHQHLYGGTVQWLPRSAPIHIRREVSIVGREPEGVRSVTATVSGDEGGIPPEQAADFLGFVAALPYEGAKPAAGEPVDGRERLLW